ncbi:unnamed protein product [Boreogadus saida]
MARLGPLVPLVPLVRLGLLLCLLPGVRGYSSGMVAPAACSNMVPSHTGSPQTGPSPFYVTSSNTTYQDGDTITVQLQSTGATPFKGFLLQAREVGGETPLGSFTVAGGAAQTLSCGLKSHNSAVSHTSSSDKNLISATWTAAASENPKDIEFRATFVESYSRFWVSVRSPILIHSGASPNITPTAEVTTASVSSGSSTPSTLSISSAGCGRTKVCFSEPLNCDPAVDTGCHFMSASVSGLRTKAEAEAHFELKGRGPGYVSFAFSQDQKMGNDDIYICGLDARGLVRVQRAYSTGRQKPNTLDLGNVSRVLGSLQDGVISCSFTSTNPISTQEGQTGFDAPYYLLFAYGPSTDGEIGFHSGRFSSSEKLTISEYKQLSISNAGCGRTKVCFSDPRNCDPAVDTACHFMSASVSGLRAEAEAEAHFELKGRGPGYVSFAFSQDQKMGNDDIYICGLDARGLVRVQRAYSTGRQKPNTLDLGNVSRVLGSLQDGVISCSFTSTNPISTQEGQTGFDAPYYLLFAYGPSTDGEIGFHSGRFSSSEKLTISEYKQVGAAGSPQSIRAHGALMLIAWMTTASLGMMVARYLKGLAKSHSPFGKAVWFLAHVSLMSLTVILTLIAFIVIFSYVRGWSGGAHPVLGCLVTILAIIQPLGALFRCGPDHRMRYVFNWLHMLNALVMKVLAVAAIFTGLLMFDRSEDQALVKVMGGFVGWEAAFYLSYELYSRCRQPGFDIDGPKAQTLSLSLLVVFFLGNLAFLVTLLVGISEG